MGVSGSGVQVVQVADASGWRSRLSSRTHEGRPSLKRITATWFGITLLYSILLMEQRQIQYALAFALSAVRFGVLAALFTPLWSGCHRLLEARITRWRLVLAHVGIGIVTLFVWMAIYFPYSAALYGQTLSARMSSIPPLQYLEFVLTYTLMVSGIVAAQLSRRLDVQLRREAQLEALAQEAELRALKAQIRPHFLFNVLNSIYSLIGTRPEEARDMITLVADLMRRTLDASDDEVVSVEWELGVVDSYLRIEKIRLGERLDVSIAKQGVSKDAVITPLILQPLVENAIKHGIGARPGPGSVEVYAIGTDHRLEFVVRDTGPGVVGEVRTLPGHGLNLTRRRLEALYGADFALTLRNLEPRGFEVRLSLPLRVLSGAPSAAASPATPNAVAFDDRVVHV